MIPLLPEQKHLKNVSKLGFLAQKGVQAWIFSYRIGTMDESCPSLDFSEKWMSLGLFCPDFYSDIEPLELPTSQLSNLPTF